MTERAVALAVAALLAACGSSGGDGPGPSVEPSLAIDLAAPAASVTTNGAVAVRVAVSGGVPDRVDLLVDGDPVRQLAAPYETTLDTSALAEGPHTLGARAVLAGRTFTSALRALVVDRTPPRVVAMTPAPGATNVWSRDPVTVEFSEPLLRSSATDGAVVVTGESGTALTKALSLSDDGRRLTIATTVLPPVPNTLVVTLGASLTDEAGNPLAPPPAWAWELPAWQTVQLAPSASGSAFMRRPASAMDSAGRLTVRVSVVFHSELENTLFRWAGGAPDPVPGALSGLGLRIDDLDVTDDGVIAVAIENGAEVNGGLPEGVLVQRYDGAAWEAPGFVDPAIGGQMQVRIDGAGRTVFAHGVPGDLLCSARVLRSSGPAAWDDLGCAVASATAWQLTIDGRGAPLVSYARGAEFDSVAWSGSAWAPVGDAYGHVGAANESLAAFYTAAGEAYAALSDATGLRVFRPGGGTGSAESIGVPCTGCTAEGWSEDEDGDPLVVWVEGNVLCAKRWNGLAWMPLASDAPCTGAGRAAIAPTGRARRPFVSACFVTETFVQHTVCGRYNGR